ncbi:MAG TPA: PA domain-containing protein [Vicinamibacteria bacterium]|nr:PA domain-containing protein [Vicinamibacteria bacterium]
MRALRWIAPAALAILTAAPASAGDILLNFVDPPGVGFNSTLPPQTPAPGNAGATLGEQRRIVFQAAANIWEMALHPGVDVVVQASFSPLACTATAGVLGAAGTIQIFANFDNAHWPNTWYHSSLANHIAGVDLTPGPFDPGLLQPPFNDDIVSFFNGDIGVNPNCLTGLTWYYGLDNNEPANGLDLLAVVLHELGHGLGFSNQMTEATGTAALGISDIYANFSRDNTSGLYWNQMDKQRRSVAAVNTNNEVWRGPAVKAAAAGVLIGRPFVRGAFGNIEAQPATFGTPLPPPPGVSGALALFNDGTPPTSDACQPVVDPGVSGKVAIIDRGTCAFAFKAAVAQLNNAVGVIIVNNLPTGLPPMGGADLIPPAIPSVGVTAADGAFLKANLGATVSLVADTAFGLAGTDSAGFPRLFAPNPAQPGSSGSHFDITLSPSALMEPAINVDLTTDLDLTDELMKDIGWDGQAHCPVGSDDRATVRVGSCSTGVANKKGPFQFSLGLNGRTNGNAFGVDMNGGCFIQDMVNACVRMGPRDIRVNCLAHTTDYLEDIGAISVADGLAIKACN